MGVSLMNQKHGIGANKKKENPIVIPTVATALMFCILQVHYSVHRPSCGFIYIYCSLYGLKDLLEYIKEAKNPKVFISGY